MTKRLVAAGLSFFMLYIVLRIVNCVLIPFVYSALNIRRLWRFLRASSDTSEDCTVNDLDWRGPGTAVPVDNDFYRDQIRARDLDSRKPRHVVCEFLGGVVRLTRTTSRLRAMSRHGQLEAAARG